MATDVLSQSPADRPHHPAPARSPSQSVRSALARLFAPLASLKLTVALFAAAIFLVFAGTLAQARYDVWQVLHQYFRTWVAWIDLQVYFPPAWFPNLQNVPGGFWYPGGFAIGALMALNLIAAHGLRFSVQARGARLWAGLAVIAAGCGLTWLVIVAGPDRDGSQATAPIDWITLWKVFLVGLACACVAIAGALLRIDPARKLERGVLLGLGGPLLALLAFLLFRVNIATLDPAAMRILWQLIKAESAALVLLAGCVLAFRKRAGIVLLHAGIGLVMANELVVHFLHKEAVISMAEGETAAYASDIRTSELAVIDPSDPEHDDVVVVPEHLLRESLAGGKPVSHPDLPFDVQLNEFYENSELVKADPDERNLADAAGGRTLKAVEARRVTGADGGDKVNQPSAYVSFLEKGSGKSLGAYLMSVMLRPQPVEVGGKHYEVALRFQRDYKPYHLALHDVRADMYLGSNVPRNYSSELQLVDAARGTDRRVMIRMNEPLRYGGETFYQSGYRRDPDTGQETTTLQVVTNFGWMIPYMACMIVATGLLANFSLTLVRFLRRREEAMRSGLVVRESSRPRAATGGLSDWFAPAVVSLAVALLAWSALTPRAAPDQFDLYAFGNLPVVMGGRVQPVDTMARNALRMISLREEYVDENGAYQPAVKWLLDLAARPDVAVKHNIFRIDNPDVRNMLGLERRKYYRYSWDEVNKNKAEYDKERAALANRDNDAYTVYEKKLAELDSRITLHELLRNAFLHRPIPPLPTEAPFNADPEGVKATLVDIKERLTVMPQFQEALAQYHPPLAVPARESGDAKSGEAGETANIAWQPYSIAWMLKYLDEIRSQPANPATVAWEAIFDAYAKNDPAAFNQAVADYSTQLAASPPEQMRRASPAFEAWFNNWRPFFDCQWLYFTAFCLAVLAWLGWSGPLNRAAFWLIAVTFLVHTFALAARMYISGRPPVTNLYSSAIFIGWAAVLAGLILESIYRLGYGNVLASMAGFATLIIADKLSLVLDQTRGDTIGVMQAVLDTQFWLATHVTCITLGYTSTLVAGLLGLVYVVRGLISSTFSAEDGKNLARMIYGAVCFGIFFSFVGTVLGGLWADDSWGRFWGWDPKENGALMIVLWNALVLHARWDGLVKDRGLALLAIGGNMVTCWSWFGVNQLGVGLHSYGFTEGVLVALGLFCLSQVALIGLGLLPMKWMKYEVESIK